jgi:organic radical activating enzyme
MNLKGIHFLLTYTCNYTCDHCFLYCSPNSQGTLSLDQIKQILDDATEIGTIETIYFEGGEAFLFYPIMLEGMRFAKKKGFKIGLVTNSYWATNVKDAEIWLRPIREIGIESMELSDDLFHFDDKFDNLAKNARIAAENLGISVFSITIETPTVQEGIDKDHEKGKPVIGGGAMFRGRAVEKLIEGLPTRPWNELNSCPYEDLVNLGRIHLDPFGNVQICQGLSIGNAFKTPLSKMIADYNGDNHPICSSLIKGGPAELANQYGLEHEDSYVDECHMCYKMRLKLIDKFPEFLCPKQVYGLENQ